MSFLRGLGRDRGRGRGRPLNALPLSFLLPLAFLLLLLPPSFYSTAAAAAAAAAAAVPREPLEPLELSLDDYCSEAEALAALADHIDGQDVHEEEGGGSGSAEHGGPRLLSRASGASLQQAVAAAMTRGWYDLCRVLIVHGKERKPDKVDFTSVVYQTKSRITSSLKDLTNAMRSMGKKKVRVATVSPAFEWAQSPDTLAVNVKLAHKLDTPATLDCQTTDKMVRFFRSAATNNTGSGSGSGTATEVVEATANATSYTFKAECKKTNKLFLLQLDLWGAVDAEGSTWEYGSVGRVTLQLRKTQPGKKWPQLLHARAKRPGNMHTWWQMQAKFDEKGTSSTSSDSNKKNSKDGNKGGKTGGTGEGKKEGTSCKYANDCGQDLVCRDEGEEQHVLVEKQACRGKCKCVKVDKDIPAFAGKAGDADKSKAAEGPPSTNDSESTSTEAPKAEL